MPSASLQRKRRKQGRVPCLGIGEVGKRLDTPACRGCAISRTQQTRRRANTPRNTPRSEVRSAKLRPQLSEPSWTLTSAILTPYVSRNPPVPDQWGESRWIVAVVLAKVRRTQTPIKGSIRRIRRTVRLSRGAVSSKPTALDGNLCAAQSFSGPLEAARGVFGASYWRWRHACLH